MFERTVFDTETDKRHCRSGGQSEGGREGRTDGRTEGGREGGRETEFIRDDTR
jgi:hypothetical protein